MTRPGMAAKLTLRPAVVGRSMAGMRRPRRRCLAPPSSMSRLGAEGTAASRVEHAVMVAADAGVAELGVEALRRRVGGHCLQGGDRCASTRAPRLERAHDAGGG